MRKQSKRGKLYRWLFKTEKGKKLLRFIDRDAFILLMSEKICADGKKVMRDIRRK
jgi:hypothetical protein